MGRDDRPNLCSFGNSFSGWVLPVGHHMTNWWGIKRDEIKVGDFILQGPDGTRTYRVKELREKDFLMTNCDSGQTAIESYQWLCMYRITDAPAEFKEKTKEQGAT